MAAIAAPGGATSFSPRNRRLFIVLALIPVVASVVAIAIWDLGVDLPFHDDWVYAWSVRQLASGHGIRFYPGQSALAQVQIGWGALVSLGHPDYRILRISALPFIGLAGVSLYRGSRLLGAAAPFALIAAAALLANPLYSSVATSYMTEPFYVGLLLAAAVAGARWLERGEGQLECVFWGTLAAAERQHGLGIPLALTAGLLLYRSRHAINRRDVCWLAVLWTLALTVQLALPVLHLSTAAQTGHILALETVNLRGLLLPVMVLPAMVGLLLAPFLVSLFFPPKRTRFQPRLLWIGGLGALGLAWSAFLTVRGGIVFPGDYLGQASLGPAFLKGVKPAIYPVLVFLAVEGLALGTVATVFIVWPQRWRLSALSPGAALLILVALTQLAPMVETGPTDRYFLPVVACLLPITAAQASATTRPKLALAFAICTALAGVVFYSVGEQDYQAWHAARDRASRLVYAAHDPSTVNAGYEANAVYWVLPEYERRGTARSVGPGQRAPEVTGPDHATIELAFADAGDPRPGISYDSLAPGKIIIRLVR